MYGDELTLVYDAYSILKTGQDQNGQFLPLFFSMGGGRPAGYIYATIPFVAIFGPTALAARAVSVFSGIGIVILLYLLCKHLFSKEIGIFAAILASINPWELSLSRGPFETHFALFLSLLGLYLFFKARSYKWLYLLSGISFALSMQTYSTYVLSIPVFTLILFLREGLYKKEHIFNWRQILFGSIIAVSFLFSIYITVSRGSKDRFTSLFIFNKTDLQNTISINVATKRVFTSAGKELANKFHNKYTENIAVLIENYTKNFSLEFLFLKGDQSPRHNPSSMGGFFWSSLPLMVLGIIYLYFQQRKILVLLFGWILIAPIAGSLVGGPHALRNSFMLPPFLIISACGLEQLRLIKSKLIAKKITVVITVVFIIQLPFFIYNFYFLSPNLYASFWSYNAKKAAEIALDNRNKFDYIILSTSIPDMEFAYPVYAKIDPKDVIEQNRQKTYIDEFAFSKYENVYLGSIPSGNVRKIIDSLKGSVLYIGPIQDSGHVDNESIQRDIDHSSMFVISTKVK